MSREDTRIDPVWEKSFKDTLADAIAARRVSLEWLTLEELLALPEGHLISRLGESGITECQLLIPSTSNLSDWFEFDVSPWLSEAVLWVRFDPDHAPVRCESYVMDVDGEMAVPPLAPSESVHQVVRGSRSRLIGMRWEL